MVEFGLKLEDNKVAEWSDEYIDYEKLKAILKKAKNASKTCDDLLKRGRPELEADIRAEYEAEKEEEAAMMGVGGGISGGGNMIISTSGSSLNQDGSSNGVGVGVGVGVDNVEMTSSKGEKSSHDVNEQEQSAVVGVEYEIQTKLPPGDDDDDDDDDDNDGEEEEDQNDNTPTSSSTRRKLFGSSSSSKDRNEDTFEGGERSYLLSTIKKPERHISTETNYGSSYHHHHNTDPEVSSTGSVTGSVGSSLVRSMSGVISYFRTSHSRKCKDAMKALDDLNLAFSQLLYQELDKVNNFFDEKCIDLEEQLNSLLESVEKLYTVDPTTGGISPPKKHRRGPSDSIKDILQKRFSLVMSSRSQPDATSTDTTPKQKQKQHDHPLMMKREPSFVLHHDDEDEDLEDVVAAAAAAVCGDDDSVVDKDKMLKVLRESDSIKRALKDLHRTAKLLSNFSMMNYTGFVKIIKKFNKTFPGRKGQFDDIAGDRICHQGKVPSELADKMEGLYAKWFCEGNVTQAQAQMLPKKGDGLSMDWSQLRLGFRLGMCCILVLWVCWDCVWGLVRDGNSTIGGRAAFPVFRACGGLLLVHWFWGFSVFIWTRYRINYIYLFDFNPRIVDTPLTIYSDCVDESLVFLVLMLLYYKAGANDMPNILPAGIYPFLLVLYTMKQLIFPWRTRAPLWTSIWHVVTAPIILPTFFMTYVADVFTSMVKVFQDILWTLCFVFSGDFLITDNSGSVEPRNWHHKFWYKNVVIPLICLFPLWIRFNQCLRKYADTGQRFPHLANAFKYAMSQTVTLFGAFHPLYLLTQRTHLVTVSTGDGLGDDEQVIKRVHGGVDYFQVFWMGIFVASSLYSFTWDVYMDWGLGRPGYRFLGPRLMYPKRIHYYGVIFIDLFLRFMWVLTLVPPQSGASFEIPNYLSAATMSIELLRRTLWGFFRLEHEHRHNTEGYRRVDFVPLHFSTGHDHKYKQQKERAGWSVLAEVVAVTAIVLCVSAASIITAHRASQIESRGEL